jgi:DNA polymerase III subunit epsilon
LIERLPSLQSSSAEGSLEYVDLLNRVLEDRKVTQAEADALYETATNWGLTREQATCIHGEYLEALVEAALEDGVVTEVERSDLNIAAQLLGFDAHMIDDMMVSTSAGSAGQPTCLSRTAQNQLLGMSVCFTGESMLLLRGEPLSRALAERLAIEAGMIVKGSVSKALDLLVVVDPDSLSGKAQKARQCGTRVMAETVFWRLVGVETQ